METKSIGLNDFEIVCRICLDKKEKMISMFETALFPNLIKTYREMLEECASVHISSDDLLPKNICIVCIKYLEQSYKFKIQYLSTEKLLEEIIANAQPNIKVEVSIDDDVEFKNEDNTFNFYNSDEICTNETIKKEFISVKEEIPLKEEEIKDKNDHEINDNCTGKYNKIKKYKCEECEIKFHLKTKLYKHLKRIHSKNMKCMSCDKIFKSLEDVREHSPELLRCKICKENFRCKNKLTEHLNVHTMCTLCDLKFQSIELCNKHLKTHANKIRLCTHCGKSFTNSSNYIVHVRGHTGEKPFQCTQCDSKFTDSRRLSKHSTKHLNERNFQCEICSKLFKRKDTLRDHEKIHTGQRNYICTYCNKAFMKSSNLKRHLRTHTGEKPFSCSKCDKSFRQKCVLTSHMKTHSELVQ